MYVQYVRKINTTEFSSFCFPAEEEGGKAAIKYKLPHINQGKTLKFSGIFSFRSKLDDFLLTRKFRPDYNDTLCLQLYQLGPNTYVMVQLLYLNKISLLNTTETCSTVNTVSKKKK